MMMTAFIVVGALLMVGLVIDQGQLRVDRRLNKSLTDVAARAGVGRLPYGPRSGACEARLYLLANARIFTSFDANSEVWSNGAATVMANPCPGLPSGYDGYPCSPYDTSSFVRFQATAAGGRFTISIQAGYTLPDPLFPNDALLNDNGDGSLGFCDNLAVIVTERQEPAFAQAGGGTPHLVRVRSVGRLNPEDAVNFVAALHLLDRTGCNVLSMGGSGTRVIAQANGTYGGTIQFDSNRTSSSCAQGDLVTNPTSPSGTPSQPQLLACSATSTFAECWPGQGTNPSRIGMYALMTKSAATVISTFGVGYGDTLAVPSPQVGRGYIDTRYRSNVAQLDTKVKNLFYSSPGTKRTLPPGCTVVASDRTCAGNDLSGSDGLTGNPATWVVVNKHTNNNGSGNGQSQDDCTDYLQFFSAAGSGRPTAQYIWFDCDPLTIKQGDTLTLSGSNAVVVVTGKMSVAGTLTVTDPRRFYVAGTTAGNDIGLDLTSPAGVLNLNTGGLTACSGRTGAGHANRLVVGDGSLKIGSSFTARLCQTFTFLASGYDKVPATNGTVPCTTTACGNYSGTINIQSGANFDISAPNEITGRWPTPAELTSTYKYEDLAMWVEGGGTANSMAGGGSAKLKGMFFFPNARPFTLTGGSTSNQTVGNTDMSAQFVSDTMVVNGGSAINFFPNPLDSVPILIYRTLLVR